MSVTSIDLITQLIAGAIGGNFVASGMKNVDLGTYQKSDGQENG